MEQLLDDFAGRKVADHAIEPAGAEDAAHRAADLRADAGRAVLLVVAQENALDVLGVVKFQQQLFRSVGGLLSLGHTRRPDRPLGRQPLA